MITERNTSAEAALQERKNTIIGILTARIPELRQTFPYDSFLFHADWGTANTIPHARGYVVRELSDPELEQAFVQKIREIGIPAWHPSEIEEIRLKIEQMRSKEPEFLIDPKDPENSVNTTEIGIRGLEATLYGRMNNAIIFCTQEEFLQLPEENGPYSWEQVIIDNP
ncbi:hypothetical protein HY469_04370 [Candidatus Roizmanbacteria bacterium]|nr:hypothetical protein [Candidatus Roizmanbacteria bacterium]